MDGWRYLCSRVYSAVVGVHMSLPEEELRVLFWIFWNWQRIHKAPLIQVTMRRVAAISTASGGVKSSVSI